MIWPSVRLRLHTKKIGSGITPRGGSSVYQCNGVLFLRSQNVLEGTLQYTNAVYIPPEIHESMASTKVCARDVLLNITGASLGRSCVVPDDFPEANVSQHVCIIRCAEDLNPNYLCNYFNSPHGQRALTLAQAGSGREGLNYQQIGALSIPLPERRIQESVVLVLCTWDRGIEQAERLLALKERRKRALMQQLLTGQRRFPEFVRSKTRTRTIFGAAPKDWPMRRFGEFLSESRQRGSGGESARKITIKLYGKGLVPKSEKRIGSESTQYYRRSVGQFIYSKLDFLNGAFGIVPEALDGYETTLDLPAFDLQEGIDPVFLLAFVTRPVFYTRCLGYAMGGRKARRVPPEQFRSIEFACPSFDEQRRIAAVLNTCDDEIRLLRAQVDALKQQKKGLMQKLLTGQVRVLGVRQEAKP